MHRQGWIEGVGEAINYIEENITEELTIENIFYKTFKEITKLTPKKYRDINKRNHNYIR